MCLFQLFGEICHWFYRNNLPCFHVCLQFCDFLHFYRHATADSVKVASQMYQSNTDSAFDWLREPHSCRNSNIRVSHWSTRSSVSCCLSLLPCHSSSCEHPLQCLCWKSSTANLDWEQPCQLSFSPVVMQEILIFDALNLKTVLTTLFPWDCKFYEDNLLCLFRPHCHIWPQGCLDNLGELQSSP